MYAIEFPKGLTLPDALRTGVYTIWTPARIRGAFGFHRGTDSDFREYARNNRGARTVIEITAERAAELEARG